MSATRMLQMARWIAIVTVCFAVGGAGAAVTHGDFDRAQQLGVGAFFAFALYGLVSLRLRDDDQS